MKAGTVAVTPLTEGEYSDLQDAWEQFWGTDSESDDELEALELLVLRATYALNRLHERKAPSGN